MKSEKQIRKKLKELEEFPVKNYREIRILEWVLETEHMLDPRDK